MGPKPQEKEKFKADISSYSDFPTLSGGPRPQQSNAITAGWSTNSAIRQPSTQQQPLGQQSQQRAPSAAPSQQSLDQYDAQRSQPPTAPDRAGSGDDFPPLGQLNLNGDAFGQSNGLGSAVGSPDMQQPRMNGQQGQFPAREGSGAFQQHPATSNDQQQPQMQSQLSTNNQQQPRPASNVKRYADMTEKEKYGLGGLEAAFEYRRATENGEAKDETLPPDLKSSVIFGQDLSTLGMDLDSPDPLYPTFTPFPAVGSSSSEFNFHDRHMVPDYTLPSAYTVTNVPSLSSRMSALQDGKAEDCYPRSYTYQLTSLAETLFSIFYQNPRAVEQELAAQELMNREWRWHKVLRQWLQRDSANMSSNNGSSSQLPMRDLTNGQPPGVPSIRLGERGEKGVFIFFDAMNWRRERRWLDLYFEDLEPIRGPAMVNGGAPGMGGPVGRSQGQDMGAGSSSIPSA